MELYISTIIRNFAISLIAIFVPVYLYTLGYTLQQIVFYYAIVYTGAFFLAPLGGKFSARFGFEHCMLYSVPMLIFYYLILYIIPSCSFCFFISAIMLAFYKSIFWPAYHANFAHYGNHERRGREISTLNSLVFLATIAGPILGGIILTVFGFKVLFVIVCLILFTSIIPLFTTLENFKPDKFEYPEAFKRLFNPKFRKTRIAFMASGEDIIVSACWPIFVFVTLANYTDLGFITSGAMVASFLFVLLIGKWTDKKDKRKMIKTSSIILFLTWLIKSSISTSWGLLFINSISGISKASIGIPMTTIIYNAGCKRGNLKCVIFREMSGNMGRALIAWSLVGILFFTQSWFIIFV